MSVLIVLLAILQLTTSTLTCVDNDIDAAHLAACAEQIGITYIGKKSCAELKARDCARAPPKIFVVDHHIRCCKAINPELDAQKISQQNKLRDISDILRYDEDLIEQTFIKYTTDKKLFAIPIDPYKIAHIQDSKKIFQDDIDGQSEINTNDIREAIRNDQSNDARIGKKINSRVKVTGSWFYSVLTSKSKPFGRVGLILAKLYTDQLSKCTGTLISPTIVITAAHCLIEDGIILDVDGIRFYPGYSQKLPDNYHKVYPTDTSFQVKAVYFPYGYYKFEIDGIDDWVTKASKDIALLELTSSLRFDYGYLAFGLSNKKAVKQWSTRGGIVTMGYPSDVENGFMYKGFAFNGGEVPKQIYKPDGMGGKIFKEYDVTPRGRIPATKWNHNGVMIDNTYIGGTGQSGSCVFYWNIDIKQYVCFAIMSNGMTRRMSKTRYAINYKTIDTKLAHQIMDIINTLNIPQTFCNSNGFIELLEVDNLNAKISYDNSYSFGAYKNNINYDKHKIIDEYNDISMKQNIAFDPISFLPTVLLTCLLLLALSVCICVYFVLFVLTNYGK